MIHEECIKCEFYDRIKKTFNILESRVKHIKPPPGEIPEIEGIDIFGEILPKEETIGGDHIIYIDFNKRYNLNARINKVEKRWEEDISGFSEEELQKNPYVLKKKKEKEGMIKFLNDNKSRAGILIADVKGHDESGSFIVGMLHQSFLTGALYEMKINGKITTNLFEKINTRFYNSSSIDDFLTMIYGEISNDGKFEFISAGHPEPMVFSKEYNRFMDIHSEKIVKYPPIGLMPSKKDIDVTLNKSILGYKKEYTTNRIDLMGNGDILLLYTDGLLELTNSKGEMFFLDRLKNVLRENKFLPSEGICSSIREEIFNFSQDIQDDITYVVIKKK